MAIGWVVVGRLLAGKDGQQAAVTAGTSSLYDVGDELLPHEPHPDLSNTVDLSNPLIAPTAVSTKPVGGPYANQQIWEDIFRFTRFPQIGDAGLPDAGCLTEPGDGNTVQVWYPTRMAVGPSIYDPDRYPVIPTKQGIPLAMSLFCIVRLKGGRFQMRCHPDSAMLHGPQRPNHSQLTRGSRIAALRGGASMYVYAAGEIYVTPDGLLKGGMLRTCGSDVEEGRTFSMIGFVGSSNGRR